MSRSSPRIGESLLLVCGAAGVALYLFDRSGVSGLPLPDLWRRSGILVFFVSAAAFAMGCRILWSGDRPQTGWRPRRSGQRFTTAVLYSRPGCHLCDEAGEILDAYRAWLPSFQEVNIDDDPHLRARFDTSIPVVELDGRVRFRGRISESLLRRLIDATPPVR